MFILVFAIKDQSRFPTVKNIFPINDLEFPRGVETDKENFLFNIQNVSFSKLEQKSSLNPRALTSVVHFNVLEKKERRARIEQPRIESLRPWDL